MHILVHYVHNVKQYRPRATELELLVETILSHPKLDASKIQNRPLDEANWIHGMNDLGTVYLLKFPSELKTPILQL